MKRSSLRLLLLLCALAAAAFSALLPGCQQLAMRDASRGLAGPSAWSGTPAQGHEGRQLAGRALGVRQPFDEVWVITRPPATAATAGGTDDAPGSGAMVVVPPGAAADAAGEFVPLPLQHTDVRVNISSYLATVDVTQRFHNPFNEKIEAAYVFPLPTDAAVNDFVMTIGPRRIRGILRAREEAERIYHEARREGYQASLLTQERPNVFTQKVANIEPGKQIDVSIRYYNTLGYVDGWFEFVFPMVVGPRYNPAGSVAGVGAAPLGGAGRSGQATEVQYLRPDQRSGHDIALAVELDSCGLVREIACPSHAIRTVPRPDGRTSITLAAEDTVPNRDFVLRFRVAGDQVRGNLLVQPEAQGGYFTLLVVPPADLARQPRQPMEMVFLLDCSGSMSGEPLAQCKAAMKRALSAMAPEDTFQVINFSNSARALGDRPVPASPANLRRGLDYVASLNGEGGTEMLAGVRAALEFPHDPARLRTVAFLTDGYIGNEAEVLTAVHQRLGSARIFSFGVGGSPNRYLMEGLARVGHGAVAMLNPGDPAEAVMDAYFQRVSRPALTEVTVDWGGLRVGEVFPRQVPDLFVGRPILLTGRFTGPLPSEGVIRIAGKAGGEQVTLNVPLKSAVITDRSRSHPQAGAPGTPTDPEATTTAVGAGAVAAVWARMKIGDLAAQALLSQHDRGELIPQVRDLALRHQLLCDLTAFVAVDTQARTGGDHGTTVHQGVPVPKGVRYDTSVPR